MEEGSGWVGREVEEVGLRREVEDWKLGFESVKRENRLSVGAEGASVVGSDEAQHQY